MRPITILPSLLASDFSRLGDEVRALVEAGADGLHLDVMDGHFVPNISFGPAVIAAVRPLTTLPFDVHLMIAPVDPYIEAFAAAGADQIIVHAEAGPHVHRRMQAIRALGKKAGLALNPGTPAVAAAPLLDIVDTVLVMTVNPGFGGQSFLRSQLAKMRELRTLIDGRDITIEVDGGVAAENAGAIAGAGGTALVAGTSVFAGNYRERIAALRHAAQAMRGDYV